MPKNSINCFSPRLCPGPCWGSFWRLASQRLQHFHHSAHAQAVNFTLCRQWFLFCCIASYLSIVWHQILVTGAVCLGCFWKFIYFYCALLLLSMASMVFRAVVRSSLLILTLYKSFTYLLLSSLMFFLKTKPFHFQARGHERRPDLALVFWCFILSYIVFQMHVCFCFVRFSFSVLTKRFAAKNVSKVTYFVSGEM